MLKVYPARLRPSRARKTAGNPSTLQSDRRLIRFEWFESGTGSARVAAVRSRPLFQTTSVVDDAARRPYRSCKSPRQRIATISPSAGEATERETGASLLRAK